MAHSTPIAAMPLVLLMLIGCASTPRHDDYKSTTLPASHAACTKSEAAGKAARFGASTASYLPKKAADDCRHGDAVACLALPLSPFFGVATAAVLAPTLAASAVVQSDSDNRYLCALGASEASAGATVQFEGSDVSIRSIKMSNGTAVYDIARDPETNPIRLLPGEYEIALEIVFDVCESCRETSVRKLKFESGHTYTWRKGESKTYGSWFLTETDEARKIVRSSFF